MSMNYDEQPLDRLMSLLGYMENVLMVYNNLQQEIDYHIKNGTITTMEAAPLVAKIHDSYRVIDGETILLEKSLDKKVRKMTGIKNLTQSAVRFKAEIQKMLDQRAKSQNAPDLTIS